MNPANFQNMGGQGMVPQGPPGAPQPQQRGGITHQAVQQQIFRMLSSQQSQQNLQGWQASVQIQQRVHVIYQLVTSLRLIKPQMDIDEAVRVALGFEQRTLFDSPDKPAYDQQCRQKIGEIAQTRSKIATSVQQQVQNGQPPMNLGQPQARMQGMPNPDQVQIQQRFPNGQMPRPNQPPAMGMPNQQQMPMGNPQARIHAVPPNMPQIVPPPVQFTQQDLQEISQLAQHMAQNTPPDQLNHIRTRLENNPQRQQILAQGLDPLIQWFKQQATRRYIELRRAQAQRNGQLVQAPNSVNPEQPRPMSQNTAHTQGPQIPTALAPQSFDPGFMGNVGQIIAQQQNAQRLAEAGHAVVPASNVQALGEQQRTAIRATPQQPNQPNATRPPQTPNVPQQPQAFWNAPGQQQPAGQVQNQSQPNLFPNVATPIPAHLQGQVGGLNTPIGRMQPQNTNMPTLTRGVGPQSQTPQPQNMWPQQGTPQTQNTAQGTPPNSHQSNPNDAPQRPRPPPGKMNHAQLQEYLSTLPETDRRTFIMHLQQQQQQRAAASGLPSAGRPESVAMRTQRSQAGPASSQPTSQLPGHTLNGTQQANGLQQQQVPAQQPGQPQRPPQQLGDAAQMARQRQQAALASGSLTPDMERSMDKYPYPPGILNANNALSKLPSTVKTWGQLKAWVKDNAGSLPPGSESKLRGLQGLHYQSMSQRQQNNQQQPGMQPTAQMMPRPNQQPVSAQTQMPNMAPPTIQEMHMTRSKIPKLQSATDEQVRNFIIRQRQDAWARARQPALNPQQHAQMQFMQERQHQIQLQQQQQQQQNQSLQPGAQPSQAPQGQAGPQKPQPQLPKKGPQNKEQPQAKAPQAPMQGQATNKGVKRGSSDDVVEVPDPKLAQQQQRSQAAKASQKPSATNMRLEQAAQTAQKQKGGQGAEQKAKPAQSTQAQQGNQVLNSTQAQQKSEENIPVEAKIKKLIDEVSRSTPPRQPVPMDVGTRSRMIPKLAQAQAMLVRLDTALPLFYRMFGGEDNTRELIRTRFLLKAQYSDSNQPINNFTISSDELDKSYNMLARAFTHIMTRVNQEKEKAEKAKGNATQDNTQGPQPPQQPAKQQPPVLSAANLQQHQNNMQAERQASVQKSHHNSNRAPPAPTSDKPPYTFGLGAQSPHGIPVYGPNELTQDNLKLPINKKRKTNNQPTSSASTPAQQAGTPHQKPSPQVKSLASPEVQKLPAPPMYKCTIPKCTSGTVGFASQSELDQHHVGVHQPKEPVIEDPLQFSLEQMRFALNLDENGKPKPKANGATVPASVGGSMMKKSSSMQGTPAMKQETATPMSRVPTHTGPSPASHLLKTPQASGNMRTPVSETKSVLKDGVAAKASTPLIVTEDPWADSLIQQDTIHEAFSGLSTLNGPKAWTKIQDYHLTPESMSSDNTTSPRPSDISENDLVKINMDMSVDDKSWIPVNWSDPMMTELEGLDLGGENWAGGAGAGADMMDWETLFGESGEEAQERARVAQRKYMRDPHGPTEEWLKVYGPMSGLKEEDQRR